MRLLRDTPFEVAHFVWALRPPRRTLVVVVKATFDLVPGGAARISGAQLAPCGDLFWDDDPEAGVRYASDFALVKAEAECFAMGSCHPPSPPVTSSVVGFSVGALSKTLRVMGDRFFQGTLSKRPSEPRPFESMPLCWERAFGGADQPDNPVGVGTKRVEGAEGYEAYPLPNFELEGQPMTAPGDRPAVASLSPIAPTWRARLRHAGTYDARWTEARFPWLAEDFDPRYFQAAPPDQRLATLRGDETIVLRHLHREHPVLESRLPGLRARAFVGRGGGEPTELPLRLDTVTLDGDGGRALCVFRGHVDVGDDHATDVDELFVMHEPLDAPTDAAGVRHRWEATRLVAALEASGFQPRSPAEIGVDSTVVLSRFHAQHAADSAEVTTPEQTRIAVTRILERGPLSFDDAGTVVFEEARTRAAGAPVPGPSPAGAETEATATPEGGAEPIVIAIEGLDPIELPPAAPVDDATLQERLAALDAAFEGQLPEIAPPPAATPLDEPSLREAFAALGMEVPADLSPVLELLTPAAPAETDDGDAADPSRPTLEFVAEPTRRLLVAHDSDDPVVGDFTGVEAPGAELGALDAPGVVLAGAILRDARLDGSTLDGAVLAGADLSGADLSGTSLRGADLTGARLTGANLTGAILARAVLSGADLVGARLDGADLSKADLHGARLQNASLTEARLDGADLSRADLVGARLERASLVDATLTGADARAASMRGAVLTGLRARDGAIFDDADLRECDAAQARFGGSSLAGTNLSLSTLDGADFEAVRGRGLRLIGCSLRKARFWDAALPEAEIVESDLMGASLLRASLVSADLRGSSFFGAELWQADLTGARRELASFEGTKEEKRR